MKQVGTLFRPRMNSLVSDYYDQNFNYCDRPVPFENVERIELTRNSEAMAHIVRQIPQVKASFGIRNRLKYTENMC